MRLTQVFVNRPTLVTVVLALVLLAGSLAAATLVQQQFPNVDIPTIGVRVSYPGASPSEINDAIVKPLENAIAGAPNLDNLNASIQEGQATITASFLLSSNKTTDLVQVQRRVQSARSLLPSDLSAPSVASFDPSEPTVATLLVTSNSLSHDALSLLVTNKIVPTLEQADGIANVDANGVSTPSINVDVDPAKLEAAGATLADIATTIANNNARLPGGYVYGATRETAIDVRGDLTTPQTVAALPIASIAGSTGATKLGGLGSGAGAAAGSASAAKTGVASALGLNPWSVSPLGTTIGNVASVASGSQPQRVFSYVGGNQAITLSAQKTTGASEVGASNALLAMIPVVNRDYPQLHLSVINVQAQFTESQIVGVARTLVAAVVVTGIVMLFFLRSWRNAIVVMIAIPTSLLVTFVIMKVTNLTVDTVSLLAMTLIIGILVDDSIVVLENIERHYDDGEAPRTAAILGRSEIGAAAIVITLVDVVVFLPIAFLPGTVGRFLAEFALVVVVATLTSLAVSFTITPSMAGNWSLFSQWKPPRLVDAFTAGFMRLRTWYVERALRWALAHRWIVVAFCALSTAGALAIVPLGGVGFEFIPRVDRGQIFMQFTFPSGTPLATTQTAIAGMTAEIAKTADVQRVTGTAGAERSGFGGALNIGSVGQIQIFLQPKPVHSTDYWAKAFGAKARTEYPRAQIVAIPATGTGGGNAQPIDYLVETTEGDPSAYADRVAALLRGTPGASNVNTSLESGAPQIDLYFNRERARALDIDIATAANAVRSSFGGASAAQIATENGTIYVRVGYPLRDQDSLARLLAIPVRARNGSIVHVGDFAQAVSNPTSPLLSRVNRTTVVHVLANVSPGYAQSNVQRAFQSRLAAARLPSNVTVVPNRGGAQQNLSDTISGVGLSLGLSILLVYLLMVALYDSYRLPFIIMFAIPVATVGALGALWLTHQTLNLFSMIGTVLLVGLVSKNGILLVELAALKLQSGMSRADAIAAAAQERFRPIVMTTSSMIAGMLPLALAIDPSSASRQSLGIVVIGGLTSSLVLTLLLVPVIFMWFAPAYARPSHGPLETSDAALPTIARA